MRRQTPIIRALATLTAVFLLTLGALPAAQQAAVDGAVSAVMQRDQVPAISIGIARNGRMLYERGYGYRDLPGKVPADAGTIYEIGSITKQFTAVMILQLLHEGKLSLDDPVAKYVANYPSAARVTLRQLLSQVSGIPDYTQQADFLSYADQDLTPAQIVAKVASLPLDFAPASKWEYSNTNYVLLGMVIEKITGRSYAEALRTRLLNPLHLTSTTYTDLVATVADRAFGYSWYDKYSVLARPSSMTIPFSAGALSSNAADLIAWDTALFSDRILPPDLTTLMMTPGSLSDGTPIDYGFGLQLTRVYGRLGVMHSGGIFGFSSFNIVFPETKLQIVILGNSDSFVSAEALAKSIAAIVEPPSDRQLEATRFRPAQNEDPKITSALKMLLLQIQTGTITRAAFDTAFNTAVTDPQLAAAQRYISSLGTPKLIEFAEKRIVAGLPVYKYRIAYTSARVFVFFGYDADGKISTLLMQPAD
ncbi:MAG: serine hydrolase domain-containing protein [Candidatus Baltobacteraceae bacterium]